MSSVFEFVAESRQETGKGVARAIRRQGNVPAILYGGSAKPQLLVLEHNEVNKHLAHEAVYAHILDIKVDGKSEKVILKDIQRHPAKAQILHMDFLRVSATEKIRVNVPLHFINEENSLGAKKGGVTMHGMVDVEISCLPAALPEYIEVDLINLDLGESLRLADIKLPEGAEIVALLQAGEHDAPIVSIVAAKAEQAEEEESEVSEDAPADEQESSD